MKSCSLLCALVFAALVLCPVAAVKSEEPTKPASVAVNAEMQDAISVFASSSGKVESVEMHEYLVGSVAAEMSPLYHTEALKAQAVASYTYAVRTRLEQRKSPDSTLKGADISDSSQTHQGYINLDKRKELWGDKFDLYEKKIESAVNEVYGSEIVYKNEPILALYHAICAGRTQSAQSMWGADIAYLQCVESPGDLLSPEYSKTVSFEAEKFEQLLKKSDITLKGEAKKWLGKIATNDDGYVKSVSLCGNEISGSKFREALGIRSSCFTVVYKNDCFTVTTNGYGHGVGMSQYGADYMARQGSTWRQILQYYYTGVTITEPI